LPHPRSFPTRRSSDLRPDFHWRDTGLSRFGRLAAWTFGATLVSQAAGIFESNVLSLATGSASIAAMTLSQAIYILPYSIVTISIDRKSTRLNSSHVKI